MGSLCGRCVSGEPEDDIDGDRELLMPGQFVVHRGPPPPYQEHAPQSMYRRLHESAQMQVMQRVTLIHSLPFGKYKESEGAEEKEKCEKMRECAICMMDFVTGDSIRFLPCMHLYHLRCVDDWLMRSLTCPTCMQRVDIALSANQRLWSTSSTSLPAQAEHQRHGSTSSVSSESSQSSGSGGGGSSRAVRRRLISMSRNSRSPHRSPPPPPPRPPSPLCPPPMQRIRVRHS